MAPGLQAGLVGGAVSLTGECSIGARAEEAVGRLQVSQFHEVPQRCPALQIYIYLFFFLMPVSQG